MTTRMNRFGFASIVLTMLVITGSYALADGGEASSIHGSFDKAECRYARWDGRRGWSTEEVRRTIRCAVGRWSVPGGVTKAVAVARCESGLNERAVSSSGTFRGVYQQHVGYWAGRYRAFAPERFELRPAILNGRTNVVVSIIQAHRAGWSAWGCA